MPGTRSKFGALAVIACALTLSACGGGDEDEGKISRNTGEALLSQLQDVDAAVMAGDCEGAEAQAIALQTAIGNLPDSVDSELRSALVKSSGNLVAQTREQCEIPEEPEEPTGPSGETGAVGDTPAPEDTPVAEPEAPADPEPAARTPSDGPGNSENAPGQAGKPPKPGKPDKPEPGRPGSGGVGSG